MALHEDQAVCVRVWDWSETSQTAVVLTKDHGMIRGIAKGSKRERSAFSGGFEVCTVGEVGVIIKPDVELALMTRWDLVGPMLGLRRSLVGYNAAIMGVDLIPRLIQDHDPHPEIYEAITALLEICDGVWTVSNQGLRDEQIFVHVSWYLWTVLVAIGAMPILDHDVITGEALRPADVYGFSAQLGGITQDPATIEHGQIDRGRGSVEGVWRIRAQTVGLLEALGSVPTVRAFELHTLEENVRISRLLGTYIRERIGTEVPSMGWLLA